MNSRFCSKTQWQMFLQVFGRHVGAHLGGHQHGGSIQISINLGKKFLLISSVRKIAVTWILARLFAYLPSFYIQILDLIDWTVFIFYFDLFWIAWHWKPAIGHVVGETEGIGKEKVVGVKALSRWVLIQGWLTLTNSVNFVRNTFTRREIARSKFSSNLQNIERFLCVLYYGL